MRPQILISEKLPEILIQRLLNSQNGNDAEILSASHLINAFNAEVRWSTRNEDGSKIDLFISYEHPWIKGERIILLVQVKSGKSYGTVKDNSFKLYKRTFKEVKQTFNNICLVWLDQLTGKTYWAYIHPNSNSKVTEYGKNHLVSPSIRYEMARNITRNHKHNNNGGNGVIINIKESKLNISQYRKTQRNVYRLIKKVKSPLLGEIDFTGYGWNHMFRKSRKRTFKKESLQLIPYLKKILGNYPSKHWISDYDTYQRGDFEFRQYNYVLTFENIRNNQNNQKHKVVIKLIEEIGYPKNWKTDQLLSQRMMRKVLFESCSLKNK